jgi:hexosaminidase
MNCTQSAWYTGIPVGQINPTLNSSYELVGDLLGDLATYFPWDLIHMGCDEVYSWCWNNTEIYDWMKEHDMSEFSDLFNYYVQTQKTVRPKGKGSVYWTSPDTEFLEFTSDDIIQYWGNSTELEAHMDNYPKNRYILSNADALYFDCGYGNYFGASSWCLPYHTWLMVYQWEPSAWIEEGQMSQILGAEAAQWSELNDDSTVLNRIFPRAAALGERVWSPFNNVYNNTLSVFERLDAWRYRVMNRGIPNMPLSAGYCEKNPAMCF